MTDIEIRHSYPAQIGQAERQGSLLWLLVLAVLLVGAAVLLSVLRQEAAEPFVLGLLALFSVVGVVALFAGATGLLRFGDGGAGNELQGDIVDKLDEGVLVTTPDDRVIYANHAYLRLSGCDANSVPSTVARCFAAHPDANDPLFRLAQAARERRQWSEEFQLSPLDSSEVPVWYRITVSPLEQGARSKDARVLWRIADVTHERERQENIYQDLQDAIDYLDNAPAGFFSAGQDGKIHYMNATLAGWLGLDLIQSTSGDHSISDIVAGEGEALLNRAAPAHGEMRTDVFDLDLMRRDGTPLPVRLLHRVSFAPDGQAGASRTLVINRSPGEEISEDLRAAEVRFTRFFNAAPIAIAAVGRDGGIVRSNAAFARLQSDADNGEQVGNALLDMVAEGDRAAVSAALEAAASGQGGVAPVNINLHGKGSRCARLYVAPVDDAEERGETVIVYAVDTTEQRALEQQFSQSQKMQAVGQLAGGVAHDFNNVLTAIIGYSDLLLVSHLPNDPDFQDIMNIKQSANRAAALVRQLLAFSRRQTLQPEVLQLTEVISDLTVMLRRLIGEPVELKLDYERDLWLVRADHSQLEQVIVNLAVNARDAMPDGGKLNIRTANVTPAQAESFGYQGLAAGEYVLVEVSDTGTGMPADVLEKIFEPFFSTKEVGKGTGLGLSTVYGIIKQTDGFIYPESEVGKGTTFRIFLPRHIPAPDSIEAGGRKVETKAKRSDLTGQGTILLVEDEAAVRSFTSRALTKSGYKVLEAGSGTEALEVFNAHDGAVDLVVSDVVMPEMDGPTLLRELGKIRPGLKTIFMSGYAEEAFAKNLDNDAEFTFLQKPFNLKQLAETVKQVLES